MRNNYVGIVVGELSTDDRCQVFLTATCKSPMLWSRNLSDTITSLTISKLLFSGVNNVSTSDLRSFSNEKSFFLFLHSQFFFLCDLSLLLTKIQLD